MRMKPTAALLAAICMLGSSGLCAHAEETTTSFTTTTSRTTTTTTIMVAPPAWYYSSTENETTDESSPKETTTSFTTTTSRTATTTTIMVAPPAWYYSTDEEASTTTKDLVFFPIGGEADKQTTETAVSVSTAVNPNETSSPNTGTTGINAAVLCAAASLGALIFSRRRK